MDVRTRTLLDIIRGDLCLALDYLSAEGRNICAGRLLHGIQMITAHLDDKDRFEILQERWKSEKEKAHAEA